MKVTDFINGKVSYDQEGGQYFWIHTPDGGLQMLAEMRGYGAIQNMFRLKNGGIDLGAANEFQDRAANWIADAINEKLEREKNGK